MLRVLKEKPAPPKPSLVEATVMQTVSDMNFGEYDAFDESAADASFFQKSFVTPISLSLSTLRNNKNYIIIGKKGAGKTSAQLFLRKQLEEQG
ncbi:MAG: hypothetical protein KGI37_04455 [Alphaproteobacteria bacterium]|nr:hypothetical protein [Alphaproteobacteria bacterium]